MDFAPKCDADQAVIVTHAFYGRMSIGTCVRKDFGFVGCSADVRGHLDHVCTGRRSCNIRIPDAELDLAKEQSCPSEFKTYLNASFICVEVIEQVCDQCKSEAEAKITLQQGYIASVVSKERSGCGTASCPWHIEVRPGQKIRLMLIDPKASNKNDQLSSTCFSRYALVQENASGRTSDICGGGPERVTEAFVSVSNSLQIHVISSDIFLLYYEAVGCPDYMQPKNTWLQREEGIVVVGCDQNDKTWRLECIGNSWQGTVGQCPQVGLPLKKEGVVSLPLGVLIAIVVGIALIIGVLILTIGVVCLKRQHQHTAAGRPQTTLYIPAAAHDSGEEMALQPSYYNSRKRGSAGAMSRGPPKPPHSHAGRQNIYAHNKMEQRPLPSIPNIHEVAEGGEGPLHHAGKELCSYHGPRVLMRQTSHPPVCKPVAGPQVPCTPPSAGGAVGGTPAKATPPPVVATAAAVVALPVRTGPSSGTGTPASSKDDPQYFVLDPDQQADSSSSGGGGGVHKSPEEENAENIHKEVHITSCHEIPLRPSREGSQTLVSVGGEVASAESAIDNSEDLEVWVLMLRSQNYYIV
ncbi:hypothetical protein CAPTEDRAFT_223753 [Capitella teleta]|uniref:CUB domain-containing protein n=1 Tax=Capitella teleta TaxID=283909 RepID=R7T8E1_CAPTE|nr:hypothetical protein CAPTEDRAFT_223753 [Capitella teleta]|eukprot:ELT89895.1 hypothetical protein CAPTEDRAFT_223753 [Capitella teleta]